MAHEKGLKYDPVAPVFSRNECLFEGSSCLLVFQAQTNRKTVVPSWKIPLPQKTRNEPPQQTVLPWWGVPYLSQKKGAILGLPAKKEMPPTFLPQATHPIAPPQKTLFERRLAEPRREARLGAGAVPDQPEQECVSRGAKVHTPWRNELKRPADMHTPLPARGIDPL